MEDDNFAYIQWLVPIFNVLSLDMKTKVACPKDQEDDLHTFEDDLKGTSVDAQ